MRKTIIASLMMLLIAAVGSPLAAQTRREATKAKTTQTASTQSFVLTKDGIGPIKLGMAKSKVPAKVAGLYTSCKYQASDDMCDGFDGQIICYQNSKTPIMAFNIAQSRIIEICVMTPKVSTSLGVKVGDPISRFKALPGSKETMNEMEGYTCYYNGHFEAYPTDDTPQKIYSITVNNF